MGNKDTRNWADVFEINESYLQIRAMIQPAIDGMVKSARPENQELVGNAGLRMLQELNTIDHLYHSDVKPHLDQRNPEYILTERDIQVHLNCYTELSSYLVKLRSYAEQINHYVGEK